MSSDFSCADSFKSFALGKIMFHDVSREMLFSCMIDEFDFKDPKSDQQSSPGHLTFQSNCFILSLFYFVSSMSCYVLLFVSR